MRKVGKLLSATVIVSTLVVGSSTAYITTSNLDAQAAEQVQKWGHGEGGASGASTQGTENLEAQIPWYSYEGYTTYDPSFTQDYNFVRAAKYDNVSINGYKVDPKAYKNYDHTKTIYDTSIDFNDDNEVIQISFNTKPNTVSKEAFKKAHASNDMEYESKPNSDGVTMISYNTNNGAYKAFFDENDNLTKIIFGQ
ncbi:hypothetical protein JTF04_03210 [Mammaliicoccus vitulinus]|uniref:immunodominant staphylococcal antigen IsaB family protein n=1 Tax=Mammaliicoccus vitulinus TaxID=71237 RepID=UPI00195238B7|nr:hypothetical protein [Mammaliicoccus vitulinus]MBM6628680.1 hypothetical protein [Mammaliicoccus vitulinus]WQK86980.1 hypothetical protein P3U62_07925 [Mammaliicoccus vitulinus]